MRLLIAVRKLVYIGKRDDQARLLDLQSSALTEGGLAKIKDAWALLYHVTRKPRLFHDCNHPKCCPDSQRQPYYISGFDYVEHTHTPCICTLPNGHGTKLR